MDLNGLAGLSGVPVVIGLVEVCKPFLADKRLWPVVGVLAGVLWNVGVAYVLHANMVLAALLGVVVGLAASGLYSGYKTMQGA